jgi:hypothetical protein
MITVAMGGGDLLHEKAMDWFERALKAQIDYDEAYRLMIGGPLLPRWGGSYAEMMQLADACIAQERFDTAVPMYYLTIVREVGRDSQRPWGLLADEKILSKVAKVAEGYAAAVEKEKVPYYKSLHAAAAWRAAKFDEARKALDELTAAGMKPHPNAFVYFDADNGVEAVSSVYTFTGPHINELRDAWSKGHQGDTAGALKAIQVIAAQLPQDDPSRPYFAMQVFQFDSIVKFKAGEWSPMLSGTGMTGWKRMSGVWSADPSGALVGNADPKNLKEGAVGMAYWAGSNPGRNPGRAFEVKGVLEFPEPAPGVRFANGGVKLYRADGKAAGQLYIDFNKGIGQVSVIHDSVRMNAQHKVALKSGCEFLVRVAEEKMTIFVNGEQAAEPFPLPDEYKTDLTLGVAVQGPNATKFKNLMIRKILPAEQKK